LNIHPVVLDTDCIRPAMPSQAKIGATAIQRSPKRSLTTCSEVIVSVAMPGMVITASSQFVRT
jgi:hypothetical protein